MNGLPPDYMYAPGGRMLSHPRFDRHGGGASAASAAAAAAGASYADALLSGRYAAAAQEQDLRRSQGLLGSSGHLHLGSSGHHHLGSSGHLHLGSSGHGYAAAPAPADSAAMIARREEELARLNSLNSAHDRIMEAELAARAMRDRVAAREQAQARAQAQAQAQVQVQQEAAQAQAEAQQAAQDESAFRADSIERIVALQEQQAARAREMARLRQAELSGEAGRALGGAFGGGERERLLAEAAYADRVHAGGPPGSAAAAYSSASQLAKEELALRERLARRRLLEEEAMIEQQQQQQQRAALASLQTTADASVGRDRDHLSRLLQLQQMSDEDLIRRATEVHSAQSTALQESLERNRSMAVEQQLLEAQLLRRNSAAGLQRFQGLGGSSKNDDLDMIDQAHADAEVVRKLSAARSAEASQGDRNSANSASPAWQAGTPQALDGSKHGGQARQPLRYFNNGIEVDMDGNPLPTSNNSAALINAVRSTISLHGDSASTSPSVISSIAHASTDSNIISKFLTVVVSRVPEIAPAVANLLPEGGDAAILKREFPNVVVATLAELRSMQERVAGATDGGLYERVKNCIEAIEPYRVDLSVAGGMAPLPAPATFLAAMQRAEASVLGQQAPPKPAFDPSSVQPLLPNNQMNLAPAPTVSAAAAAAAEPAHLPGLPVAQAGAYTVASAAAPPDEDLDLTMMSAHRSTKKKPAKKSKKKNKKTKMNRTPKLVHDGLAKRDPEMGETAPRKTTLARGKSDESSRSDSTLESSPLDGAGAAGSERNVRPVKKRRISDEDSKDADTLFPKANNSSSKSPSVSQVLLRESGRTKNAPGGPHGELLDQLFGGGAKASTGASSATKTKAKPSSPGKKNAKKRGGVSKSARGAAAPERAKRAAADADHAVITDDSEHAVVRRDNSDDEHQRRRAAMDKDDPSHLDAASVLLGLMKK